MLRRHRVGDDSGAEPEQDIKADGSDTKSAELSLAAPTSSRSVTPDPHIYSAITHSTVQIQGDEKIIRITGNPVPFGSLPEALSYVVFLILFILATTVMEENTQAFYFANRLKTALVDQSFTVPAVTTSSSTSTTSTFSDSSMLPTSFTAIRDQAQMWAFLQGPFADVVYGAEEENNNDDSTTTSSGAGNVVSSSNRLLGGVRLRTLRVKAGSCPSLSQIPEYETIVPFCYGKFSASSQETQGYGLILNSADIIDSISYATARLYFADLEASGVTKVYTHLQTCYLDCERICGDQFGVDKFRYASQCIARCTVQCTCIYEEPVGIHLCTDPNPNGEGGAIPTAVHAYNWSSAKVTEAQTVRGYTEVSFPGSGYVVNLGLNGTLSRERLAELKRDRYLDLPTRALIVDFTVFNAYLQLFNIVEIVVEFPASGGAFVQLTDAVLRLFRYSSASTRRIILEGFVVFYVLIEWWCMLKTMYRDGVKKFLTISPWNVLTTSHLVAFALTIAVRLYTIDLVYGTMSGKASKALTTASLEEIPNLQGLATVLYAETVIGSINAALVWLKLLQYTTVSKRMSLLLRMLGRAARDLAWFFVCFLVCICAFAQIGLLLFGLDVRGFSSLGVAIVTLLQAVAGELDYAGMEDSHRVAGPVFYIMYYLLLLLILVNVFLAILNDAYMQTITELEEEDDEIATAAHDHAMDWDEFGDVVDANADISPSEKRSLQAARREMEQLRKYPFSKGFSPALRLLVIDIKRVISGIRTGNNGVKFTKVDRLIMQPPKTGNNWPPSSETASRKLTRHVKRQVASELLEAEDRLRVSRRVELQQSQIENLRHTVDEDVAIRLEALAESNRLKTKRMHDLERTLGSIEKLCEQLVSDTACLRVDRDDEGERTRSSSRTASRPSRTSSLAPGGKRKPSGGSNRSLSLAIMANRQREAARKGEELDEINL
ncbi:Polycystin Cation Channel [Phytophthora megakarya]|uniref:Polycystin Cation Channel n=1 Tax=Phytophthora megakarya TaxID=4795 RepID=A0A225WVN6_9STRA|nr:Polycystin Cation Channel [Phytophthora megakarya]